MLPPLEAPETQHITGDWVLFHPVYTPGELKAVDVGGGPFVRRGFSNCTFAQVLHRPPQTLPDKFAYRLVRLCR